MNWVVSVFMALGWLGAMGHPQFSQESVQRLVIETTRLKQDMVNNPVLYMDEPVSGKMEEVVKVCDLILDLLGEEKVDGKRLLYIRGQLNQELTDLRGIGYDQRGEKKPESLIRRHYFPISEF